MTASRRRSRGQVLVLACVTFLTMALMMMASFGVANAVHERIRVQAAADAQAFSVATMEARAFNTMAYMNRAIVGALVSEMALHAWKAIAERDESMMRAGFFSFLMVAAIEFSKCPKFNLQHCWHGIEALMIAFEYNSKASEISNEIQSKDSQFKGAVTSLNDAIKELHAAQKEMLGEVKKQMGSGSTLLGRLLRETAPQASPASLSDYNTSDFACALEGSGFDDDCQDRSWKGHGSVLSASRRRDVIESAAMAARNGFEAGGWMPPHFGRKLSGDDYKGDGVVINPLVNNPDAAMDIQDEGSFREIGFMPTEAEVASDNVSGDVKFGLVTVSWKHGNGIWFTNGSASSGSPYRGVPCSGDDCFINFRMHPTGGEDDYGQPATYGAVKQDLRKTRDERTGPGWVSARPWEVNTEGTVSVKLTKDKPAELKLVSQKPGYGIAKGKTYFHQLGAWDVPPNMFDPFWRAKLHPFVRDELAEVLGTMGDSNGKQIINDSNSAVEGVIK
ncbi:MAG: Tad domain-containing protein [Myxococcales bacterium]|nr:Tad domain-containing protein [Myxococcales bacterium]